VAATAEPESFGTYGVLEMGQIFLSLPAADFNGHMDWDEGWSVVMVAGMVLVWALLIAGVVWAVRELARGRSAPEADPLRTLERRLAEGSISADEYRELRAILTADEAGSDS
jgi:hypothetical protein